MSSNECLRKKKHQTSRQRTRLHSSLAGAEREAARAGPAAPREQDGLCAWSVLGSGVRLPRLGRKRHCDSRLALSWIPSLGAASPHITRTLKKSCGAAHGTQLGGLLPTARTAHRACGESAWKRGPPTHSRLGQRTATLSAVL